MRVDRRSGDGQWQNHGSRFLASICRSRFQGLRRAGNAGCWWVLAAPNMLTCGTTRRLPLQDWRSSSGLPLRLRNGRFGMGGAGAWVHGNQTLAGLQNGRGARPAPAKLQRRTTCTTHHAPLRARAGAEDLSHHYGLAYLLLGGKSAATQEERPNGEISDFRCG